MSPKWLVGMTLLWLTTMMVSLILDSQYLGASQSDVLNTLLHPEFIPGANIPFAGFFIVAWTYLVAFFDILTYNYSFFTGSWVVLKYVGWTLSIATIIGLVLALRGSV